MRIAKLFVFLCLTALSREYSDFQHILIDTRGARAGNGDVSAGLLFAKELIQRKGVKGPIVLITDQVEEKILSTLIGRAIVHGDTLENGKILIQNYKEMPSREVAYDLVVHLARPSGLNYAPKDYRVPRLTDIESNPKYKDDADAKILLAPDAHFVIHTVLGNTENENARQPFSLMKYKGESYFIRPAGLGTNESGIYLDTSAATLANRSHDELRSSLKKLLGELSQPDNSTEPNKEARFQFYRDLLSFLEGQIFAKAQMGFAYGIGAQMTPLQYSHYLEALGDHARATGNRYVIFSPSTPNIKSSQHPKIKILNFKDKPEMPKILAPGTVYLFYIPNIPNELFNHLLACSQIPPVIAGDGALSAAIAIGKPFLMTNIPWNEENLHSIRRLLASYVESEDHKRNIQQMFGFKDVQYLGRGLESLLQEDDHIKRAYRHLSKEVPLLTQTTEDLIQLLDQYHAQQISFEEVVEKTRDPIFRTSFIVNEYKFGNNDYKNGRKKAETLLKEFLSRKTPAEVVAFSKTWDLDVKKPEFLEIYAKSKIFQSGKLTPKNPKGYPSQKELNKNIIEESFLKKALKLLAKVNPFKSLKPLKCGMIF